MKRISSSFPLARWKTCREVVGNYAVKTGGAVLLPPLASTERTLYLTCLDKGFLLKGSEGPWSQLNSCEFSSLSTCIQKFLCSSPKCLPSHPPAACQSSRSVLHLLIAVLICMSWITNEIGHPYLCSLAFWMSSPAKYLFKSFPQFSIGFVSFTYWFVEVCYIFLIWAFCHTRNRMNKCVYINERWQIPTDWGKTTRKGSPWVLTQADDFEKNGSLEVRGLEIDPCKPSFPPVLGKSLCIARCTHTPIWRMSVWNILSSLLFFQLHWDIIDI